MSASDSLQLAPMRAPENESSSDDSHPLQRTSVDEKEEMEVSDINRTLAILALAMCYVALDYIVIALNLNTANSSWVPNSSSVATACTVPCAGYLQDLFGRRASLAFGLVCVLIGTLITALAQNFATLIAGGVLTGIGSGIEELTAIAAISELVPARSRGLYLGLINAMNVPFTPAVLYAAEVSTHSTWRWLFWISLCWNGMAAIVTAATYFRMKLERSHSSNSTATFSASSVDYIGMILFIAGIVEILIAIQAGGQTNGWTSAYVLVQLFVGVALIGLFIFWESFGRGSPVLPMRLFHGQRVVSITYIICFLSGMPYSAALNLGTTINNFVWQASPARTGVVSLGPSLGLAAGAFAGNALISVSKGYAREVVFASAVVMTAFTGAEAVISPTTSTLWAILGTFSSMGIGATLVPLSTIVTLACPQDLIGTAVAFTITIRTLGGSVGYAIFDNIFSSQLKSDAPPAVAKATNLKNRSDITTLITYFEANMAADRMKAVAEFGAATVARGQRAFQSSAGNAAALVYYVSIAFSLCASILALFLPNMKKYLTKRRLTKTASDLAMMQT